MAPRFPLERSESAAPRRASSPRLVTTLLTIGKMCVACVGFGQPVLGSPYIPVRSTPAPVPANPAPAQPAPTQTGASQVEDSLPSIKAPALRAVVTVAPLKSFVEPLLPEGSQLRVLMQPGRSEHGYEFTPSDLRAIAEADVVVLVGLNLEPAVEKTLANRKDPSRRVVRFSDVAGIQADPHAHHDHEHGEECDHGPVDPHLWLDPILCETLVGGVRAAIDAELAERNALTDEVKAALAAREASLRARIARVDQAWRDAGPMLAATPIVTHHNAFPRLSERYGMRIAAVIREIPTTEPSPAQVANVARTIREQNVRTIYVEPQFNRKLADRIAKAAGVSVATLDPLGTGDWFALMDSNLASIRANAPNDATSQSPSHPASGT